MRPIDTIIVHHTAGATTVTVEDIRREHRARGWSDIGYHWVVHQLGAGGPWSCSRGRDEQLVGAHDADQNARSVGISLAGDYTRGPVAVEAWSVFVATVASRCRAHRLGVDRIEGHKDHEPAATATACPGFDVSRLRVDVADLLRRQ